MTGATAVATTEYTRTLSAAPRYSGLIGLDTAGAVGSQ